MLLIFILMIVDDDNVFFCSMNLLNQGDNNNIQSRELYTRVILDQYAQAMDPFCEESECRVCRDTGTESEPLLSPCKCDGSIKFVHESCLLRWLSVKKIDSCELCGHRFVFASVYSNGAPERLLWHEFMHLSLKTVASHYQTFLKVLYCIFSGFYCFLF